MKTGKNNNIQKESERREVTELEKKQRIYFGGNDSCGFDICHTSWNFDSFFKFNTGVPGTTGNRVYSCCFGSDQN